MDMDTRQEVINRVTNPNHVGVINPYALAQLRLRQRINWCSVDSRKVLEMAFDMPYEELFDPIYDSPLYPGVKYDKKNKSLVRKHASHRNEDELQDLFKTPSILKKVKDNGFAAVIPRWIDMGHFFVDAAQFVDPIQGNLADCYFIAALASVAWALPFTIAQRTRSTDATGIFAEPGAVDMLQFHDGNGTHNVEVSELLPTLAGSYLYARADIADETWPAIYEKAYAKWKTNDSGDQPNFPAINYGDPVLAAVQLTGLSASYYSTEIDIYIPFVGTIDLISPDEIYQTVRANSLGRKTVNPMVAWTYPSGDASPSKVNYGNANLVANHAYSILGWQFDNGQEYIVLRNPWGQTEATTNVDSGNWVAFDGSYWRFTPLSAGGVFALRADTFQQYFAGYGVVK